MCGSVVVWPGRRVSLGDQPSVASQNGIHQRGQNGLRSSAQGHGWQTRGPAPPRPPHRSVKTQKEELPPRLATFCSPSRSPVSGINRPHAALLRRARPHRLGRVRRGEPPASEPVPGDLLVFLPRRLLPAGGRSAGPAPVRPDRPPRARTQLRVPEARPQLAPHPRHPSRSDLWRRRRRRARGSCTC